MNALWLVFSQSAEGWLDAMVRASLYGALAVALAWAACRTIRRLPAPMHCWLWRIASAKFLVALLGITFLEIPVLPARPSDLAPAELPPAPQWQPEARAESLATPAPAWTPPPAEPIARRSWPNLLFPTLLAAWLACVGWHVTRLALRIQRTRWICRTAHPAGDENGPEAAWVAVCRHLYRSCGVVRMPRILFHSALSSPLVVGLFRPTILVPQSLTRRCSPAEMRMVLGHELAHLARHDLAWAWMPTLVRILFFFHPLAWLAARQCRLAEEKACDERAITRTGESPAAYGQLIVGLLASARQAGRRPLAALGATGSFRDLRERMLAMHTLSSTTRSAMILSSTLVAVFAMVLLIPWRLSAAQAAQSERTEQEELRRRAAAARAATPSRLLVDDRDTATSRQGNAPRTSGSTSAEAAGGAGGGGGVRAGGGFSSGGGAGGAGRGGFSGGGGMGAGGGGLSGGGMGSGGGMAGGGFSGGAGGGAGAAGVSRPRFGGAVQPELARIEAMRLLNEQIARMRKQYAEDPEMIRLLDQMQREMVTNLQAQGRGRAAAGARGFAAGRGGGGFGGGSSFFGRQASFFENGRSVEITENDRDGIRIRVVEEVDGQERESTYEAATPEELRKKAPEIYELYQRYIDGPAAPDQP